MVKERERERLEMKETKKSASGAFSSSAAARGKFRKVFMVLLLVIAVFCGFAPRGVGA